ncbi:hypothetical protein [Flavobacterium caseinilyticum]|uniref:Uncharacterized protein n=1 Tax=Flavobacterium caseinilyticum TaxID=2541732 RepID=A0A4R5AW97_9FLAO|nr:hypothetical protein [Flavobacterium caseinilyticum]TDD77093.1 hypothetical protein E0F89_05710 [Flavobacterium caseinilyticum]
MENNHYRIDTAALQVQQEIRVSDSIAIIEQKCMLAPVQFLKSNLDNKKLRERTTEPDIKITIGTMLIKIGTLAGIKNEIDSLVGQDIMRMILTTYADLTLEEIYKAFELERYGSFEDKTEHFQLFNADYIAKILKKYKNWKLNMKMNHDISKNSTLQLAAVTEGQKEQILIDGVNRVFQEYQETNTISDPSEYIFDFLVEKGKIKNSNNPKLLEYYQLKLQQAKTELSKEQSKKTSTDKLERQRIKVDMEQIVAGYSPKIIIRAKRNILKEYFDKQISLKAEKII